MKKELDIDIFIKQIERLTACFPKSAPTFNDSTLDIWYEELKVMSDENFTKGVDSVIHNKKFFPAISELRESHNERRLVY